jgi:hypothetical protein
VPDKITEVKNLIKADLDSLRANFKNLSEYTKETIFTIKLDVDGFT